MNNKRFNEKWLSKVFANRASAKLFESFKEELLKNPSSEEILDLWCLAHKHQLDTKIIKLIEHNLYDTRMAERNGLTMNDIHHLYAEACGKMREENLSMEQALEWLATKGVPETLLGGE